MEYNLICKGQVMDFVDVVDEAGENKHRQRWTVIFESAVEGVAQTPAIRVSFAVLEGAPAPSFDIGAEVKVGFEERFSAPKAEEKSEPLAVPVLPEFN